MREVPRRLWNEKGWSQVTPTFKDQAEERGIGPHICHREVK